MTAEEDDPVPSSRADDPRLPDGLETAPHLLVALDYDGTLAPFRTDPASAVPLPGILPVVHALARLPRVSVAIVSGRPIAELERFVMPQDAPSAPLILVGEHGWERRDGPHQRRKTMSDTLEGRLDRALRVAEEAGTGAWIERKRAALVLHLRGLAPDQAEQAERRTRSAWERLAGEPGDPADALRLETIDGGVELRAGAHDKGSVLRELLETMPPGTETIYVGDDRTDEDAFRVLAEHRRLDRDGHASGLAVRVAREPRPTAAHATVTSCEALRDWLERLLHHLATRNLEDDAG